MTNYIITYKDKTNSRTLFTNNKVASELFIKQLNTKKYISEIVVKQY